MNAAIAKKELMADRAELVSYLSTYMEESVNGWQCVSFQNEDEIIIKHLESETFYLVSSYGAISWGGMKYEFDGQVVPKEITTIKWMKL